MKQQHACPPVYTRLKFLKQQRRILLGATLFLMLPALLFLSAHFFSLWENTIEPYSRYDAVAALPFSNFFFLLHSDALFIGLVLFLLPFSCIVLLFSLAFLLRRNVQLRVIRSESFWTILLGVLIPCLLWMAAGTPILTKWYGGIESVATYWISAGLILLIPMLLHNVFQYSSAIRRTAASAGEETVAEWGYTRLRELRDQRFFLICATIFEMILAAITATSYFMTLVSGEYPLTSSLIDWFAFPISCLVLLVALIAFNRKNKGAPMMHNSCIWIICGGIFAPTAIWFVSGSSHFGGVLAIFFSAVLLFFLLLLNYQLIRGLQRYGREIEQERHPKKAA